MFALQRRIFALQQDESAACMPVSPPSSPFPRPTPLASTEPRAELPMRHGSFPLASSLTRGRVYVSVLLFPFLPPALPLCLHMSVLHISLFVCLFFFALLFIATGLKMSCPQSPSQEGTSLF